MLGNKLLAVNAETFFSKNVAKVEVVCRNKEILRDWHIFVPSKVRTLIFHILPPETYSLNLSKKVPKISKLLFILRALL